VRLGVRVGVRGRGRGRVRFEVRVGVRLGVRVGVRLRVRVRVGGRLRGRVGRARVGLVVDEPHAPVAEALPLAKGIVRHVAVLEGGVHGHRPARGHCLQLLHEEGVPVGHLGDREDAKPQVRRHIG
tara:strand:- start:261 stop:638 length:378 start_codon:yes stop_codon:yes gene_type:complete